MILFFYDNCNDPTNYRLSVPFIGNTTAIISPVRWLSVNEIKTSYEYSYSSR